MFGGNLTAENVLGLLPLVLAGIRVGQSCVVGRDNVLGTAVRLLLVFLAQEADGAQPERLFTESKVTLLQPKCEA